MYPPTGGRAMNGLGTIASACIFVYIHFKFKWCTLTLCRTCAHRHARAVFTLAHIAIYAHTTRHACVQCARKTVRRMDGRARRLARFLTFRRLFVRRTCEGCTGWLSCVGVNLVRRLALNRYASDSPRVELLRSVTIL
jgi:hypothetical protein